MFDTRERRKHDLLGAACIVAGFGLVLGLVLLATRRTGIRVGPSSPLMAEAQLAIAEGDRAASDEYLDYTQARQEYLRAFELLRSIDGECDEERAKVRFKIVQTYLKENDYASAKREVEVLLAHFPHFRPEEMAALHRRVSKPADGNPPPPTDTE